MTSSIEVNGRRYARPQSPVVVVCIDGSEPDYIEQATAAGLMPNVARMIERGCDLRADSVVPSFTNPNNLSVVTGRPPAVHGISGNYFLDPETGTEVMMNDPKFLRAPTIFPAFQAAGARIAVITAKDKLRLLLGHGLTFGRGGAICFSSEKADRATLEENGIDGVPALVGMEVPDVYSAGLSEFVLRAGVRLMAGVRPDLMYLSTTDYIQHKHAPGTSAANAFYAMIDTHAGALDAAGAVVVLTADHGMNDKHRADGSPDVIYLQDELDAWLGAGRTRVICPITDPYVVHHGALGSFVTVYLSGGVDRAAVLERLRDRAGIDCADGREAAAARFELPPDRLGDIVVTATRHVVIGTSVSRHDLSALKDPLRSHGGLTEQRVPLIVNRKVSGLEGRAVRNFDAFDIALNRVRHAAVAAAE